MTVRRPLVIGDDKRVRELPSGDTIVGGGGGSSAVQLMFGVGPVGTGVTTGAKRTVQVFDEIELTGWALAADAAGTLELDIWVSASFPPAVGDSIVASAPPELVSAASATGGVSGWTTTIPPGSWVTFAVTAAAGVTRFDLALAGTRS